MYNANRVDAIEVDYILHRVILLKLVMDQFENYIDVFVNINNNNSREFSHNFKTL